jgi:general secretion pathway protein G
MKIERGFTLVELLVVLAIIGTLLSLAAPRYFRSMEKAKESVLRENLNTLRATIDKYFSDTGMYPASLSDLVLKHYLRKIPEDPLTESDSTWTLVPPVDKDKGDVYDVKSGAQGRSQDGTAYKDW